MADLPGYHSLSSVTGWTSARTRTRTTTVKVQEEEEEEEVAEVVVEQGEEEVLGEVERQPPEEVEEELWQLEDQLHPRGLAEVAPALQQGPEVG